MSDSKPLVSILINNYNYGRFLREAIDSALSQTYSNTEVIVVDDGSTDDSRDVIASYGARIIPVLKENGGQASAFNAGFAVARGEWICLLDSDDIWAPTKVEAMVEAARSSPDAALIYHMMQPVSADLLPVGKTAPRGLFRGDVSSKVRTSGGWWSAPPTSGLCFSRDAVLKMGSVPESDFRICADAYLCTIAPFLGPLVGVAACLAMRRLHNSNSFTGRAPRAGGDGPEDVAWLEWHQRLLEKMVLDVNSRLEELRVGAVLDVRRHRLHRLTEHRLKRAGRASLLRLSWESLWLGGEPSLIARVRWAGGLLLHGVR
jgi:glycosyltransferase involved in cell wall biosynthesis